MVPSAGLVRESHSYNSQYCGFSIHPPCSSGTRDLGVDVDHESLPLLEQQPLACPLYACIDLSVGMCVTQHMCQRTNSSDMPSFSPCLRQAVFCSLWYARRETAYVFLETLLSSPSILPRSIRITSVSYSISLL